MGVEIASHYDYLFKLRPSKCSYLLSTYLLPYVVWPVGIMCRCRSRINIIVLELLEKEDLQKLQKKWWYDKGQCVVESDNKVFTLNFCFGRVVGFRPNLPMLGSAFPLAPIWVSKSTLDVFSAVPLCKLMFYLSATNVHEYIKFENCIMLSFMLLTYYRSAAQRKCIAPTTVCHPLVYPITKAST